MIEPSVLAEKHFTSEDDFIRKLDIPERMQSRFLNRTIDFNEIEDEVNWIASNPKYPHLRVILL